MLLLPGDEKQRQSCQALEQVAHDDYKAQMYGVPCSDAAPPALKKDMAVVFTCTECETRAAKRFTRLAYETGVVIIQCPGCQNRHLIADNLGWFREAGTNVEALLAEKGEQVARLAADGQIDIETLVGGTIEVRSSPRDVPGVCALAVGMHSLRLGALQSPRTEAGTCESLMSCMPRGLHPALHPVWRG